MSGKSIAAALLALLLAFPLSAPAADTYEADYVPWSGYWWPFRQGGIVTGAAYRGHPSPLEKYDFVTSGTYRGEATAYGMRYYQNPFAKYWEGMCYCWAAAAILEEEPVNGGFYGETIFYVGDKKALLTVANDNAYTKSIRLRTETPEEFHAVLEEYIRERGLPFIMDLGTDDEVWNYPVYKYETGYTEEGGTRHYTTKVYYVSDEVSPDYVGSRIAARTFYYYFTLEGSRITGSGWEKGSAGVSSYDPVRDCLNPGIDYARVRDIVYTYDDRYEENDTFETAAAVPGGHLRLMSCNADFFKVFLGPGDRITAERVNGEGTPPREGQVIVQVYGPDPDRQRLGTLLHQDVLELTAYAAGHYYFEVLPVRPDYYSDTTHYEPVYDLYLSVRLGNTAYFPDDPGGSLGNGMAVLNPDGTLGRVILATIDPAGRIEEAHEFNGLDSQVRGTLADFGLGSTRGGYVRVDSDETLRGLNALSEGKSVLYGANLLSQTGAVEQVSFPYSARSGGWKTFYGLINTGDETEEVERRSFDSEGHPLRTDTVTLGPGQKLESNTKDLWVLPNSPVRGNTMTAVTTSGRPSLLGYMKLSYESSSTGDTALVPLGREGAGTRLFAPQVACNAYWRTKLLVMNSGAGDTRAVFRAYRADGWLLGEAGCLLKPGQNLVRDVPDIFPGVLPGEIASLEVTSREGEPLTGCVLFSTNTGGQLAGVPLRVPATGPVLHLPHVASLGPWGTGVAVLNPSDGATDVTMTLHDAGGAPLGAWTGRLNPRERIAGTLKNLFGAALAEEARYVRISSGDTPLCGLYLIATGDGTRLMGDGLTE